MTHATKVKLARSMRTPDEASKTNRDAEGKRTHEGIFTSKAWELRKAQIAARVARKQAAAHARAEARHAGPKVSIITRATRLLQAANAARIERKQRRQAAYDRRNANHTTA